MKPNNEYWLTRSGDDYRQQQQIRRESAGDFDSTEYAVQERFFQDVLHGLVEGKAGRLKVLDFGCGFGRLAPIFLANERVEYTGFDFSEAMAGGFREAAEVFNEPNRLSVYIGESLDALPANEKYDLIFTVAVLIHNAPEDARQLLVQMRQYLKQDGMIVLIENPISAGSELGNLWHGGCWVHDVVHDLAPDMNVRIYSAAIPNQAAYMLSEMHEGASRVIESVAVSGDIVSIDAADIDQLGQATLQVARQSQESALVLSEIDIARFHDLSEVFNALSRDVLNELHAQGFALDVMKLEPWEVFNYLHASGIFPNSSTARQAAEAETPEPEQKENGKN